MNVYVFRTSIDRKDVRLVNSILRSIIPESIWNFDLEDRDNILRIESEKHVVNLVCSHLKVDGFVCEELK